MNATAHAIGDIVFERYRIERYLPEGGFSQNYVAIDTQSEQKVAIKQFSSSASNDQSREIEKRMFREEAEILERFGAPNSQIPAWLGFINEYGSEPVIIQEFIEGETYEQRVTHDCVFGEPAVIEFLREVLAPIATLHDAGYCHRDISPENVIRSSQHYKPVLIDFGTAAQYRCRADLRDRKRIAKPGYTAPEQEERGEFSPQSDLFSLGCTLVFLLTGRDPDTFSRDARGNLNWRGGLEISDQLVSLIDQLVALDPHQRPSSTQAIAQTLATFHDAPPDMPKKTVVLHDSDPQPPRPPIQPPHKPPKQNPAPLLIGSALVLAGLITTGFVVFQDMDNDIPVIQPSKIELDPPSRPEDTLTPETPTPTETPTPIATPNPSTPTPTPESQDVVTPQPTPAVSPDYTNSGSGGSSSYSSGGYSAPSSSYSSGYSSGSGYSSSYSTPSSSYSSGYSSGGGYSGSYSAPSSSYSSGYSAGGGYSGGYTAPSPSYYVAPAPAPAPPPASSLPSCADVAWGECQ